MMNKLEDLEKELEYVGGGTSALEVLEDFGVNIDNLYAEEDMQEMAIDAIQDQDYFLATYILEKLQDGYDDTIYYWRSCLEDTSEIVVLDSVEEILDFVENKIESLD